MYTIGATISDLGRRTVIATDDKLMPLVEGTVSSSVAEESRVADVVSLNNANDVRMESLMDGLVSPLSANGGGIAEFLMPQTTLCVVRDACYVCYA